MDKEIEVVFQPSGRRVFVLRGTVILEAAARAGFIIATPCGGMGKCGKCLVRVTGGKCHDGASEHAAGSESHDLGPDLVKKGYRRACQARVNGPLTVEIPETSLFETQQRILELGTGEATVPRPAVTKRFVQLDPPDRERHASDVDHLRAGLHSTVRIGARVLRKLPGVLRRSGYRVTAVSCCDEMLDVEPGDTSRECRGVAFDIGTTTLVGTLIDLVTGADLAVASAVNPQTSFGDDVISRISRCRDSDAGLAELQQAVLEAVRRLIDKLVEETGVDRNSIYEAVFAGNTTMQQILCGVDPSPLGEMPFLPATTGPIRMPATDLELNINPAGRVYVLPAIGGFVGGDTVAGIVASHLDRASGSVLLVDIGTNGELVLARDGKMTATSVAAGPAFEGARIVNGMRATAGAIEKVVIDHGVHLNVIGNTKPAGICGTGLVDAVAYMLRSGILDVDGRILSPDETGPKVPDSLRKRLIPTGAHFDFLLADAAATATGEPLCIYQRDIRELQLANGAIRAGMSILLRTEGLEPAGLESVLLAGAFGNFIRRSNARRIGMLPLIPKSKIRFIGNAASFGAKRVLLSVTEREHAEEVVSQVRHVDLSLHPEFQMEFGEAMMFPGPEADECE